AQRRDFTINGLFYDLQEECVLDYVGGLRDLSRQRIRAIGDPAERFAEDRLRLLRAVRIATVLGFAIETQTWQAVLQEAPSILEVSSERIRQELEKMWLHPRRELGYYLLSDSGLMEAILPEVEAMRGVVQPAEFHPEGDVHRHTALVLSKLKQPSFTLLLGALLHDVGKPPTIQFSDRIRFNNHDIVGAEMAERICERLRLSRREREEVVYLVRRHLVFMAIEEMRVATRKRLFEEPHFESLLELCYADCMGSHRNTGCCEIAKRYYQEYLAEGPPVEPLLKGRDLLALGFRPGPRMGEILDAVEDARREGEVKDCATALAWVQERYSQGES
ncbi:MAG: HD domain-containing protein, partial [Planctomycetota bacterium]